MSTDPKNLKTIRSLFKQNDVMVLKFSPNFLTFESEDKSEYELKAATLQPYGIYLSREQSQIASHYSINLSFKHINGLMKIAEYFDCKINAAMETVEDDSAVIFMFAKG